MKFTLGIIGALSIFAYSAEPDCNTTYDSTLSSIKSNKHLVLDIVTLQIESHPDCVCEIVKAAILGSEAKGETVGDIVNTATVASPDNMRLISQCAIATAPDAIAQVQQVVAKYTPQAGESYSAKGGTYSSKGGTYSSKGGTYSAKGGYAANNGNQTAPLLPSDSNLISAQNPLDGSAILTASANDYFVPFETPETPSQP